MLSDGGVQFWTLVGTAVATLREQRINKHESWQKGRADVISPFLLLGWIPTRRMQSRWSSKPAEWRKPILRWVS